MLTSVSRVFTLLRLNRQVNSLFFRFMNISARYAIIFWNHGGGAVGGYGYAETNKDNPSMGLEGIQKGIGDALAATGERFELIGFDTCLLATTELAAGLQRGGGG